MMIDPILWARRGLFAACLALASCSTPSSIDWSTDARPASERFANYPDWAPSGEAGQARELADVLALAEAYPNSASVQRRILGAAFQAEEREATGAALERLGRMGYVLSQGAQEQLTGFLGEAAVAAYSSRIADDVAPRVRSELAATIPADFPLTESVAQDPLTGRLFSVSIAHSKLIASDDGIDWRELAMGEGRPMGLALDAKKRLLWVSYGHLDEEVDAFVGLAAYDIDSDRAIVRVGLDGAFALNDLAIAPDGSVLASDSLGGGVYRLPSGASVIERIDTPGTFRSPQGIAVHPQGDFAYVADYAYGIAILDLETGAAKRLAAIPEQMLDGVDGLFFRQPLGLIAIQNGVQPNRIMLLHLTTDGGAVTQLLVPERAHPDWGEPTTGQYRDGQLLYIAKPQWDRFGEGGMVEGDEPLEPNRVHRLAI